MALPRPSMSTDNARDAALQAEFNEKKWVWVPDEREGYLAGWVTKEDDEQGDVVIAANSEIRRVSLDELSKMNPPKFDRVEDMADLTFLNEASVVHNLRLRYGSDAIYTYSGLFLVAMNPYKQLPNLYSDKSVAQYRARRRDENPPHIFAIAERAWVNMGEERENQSILITGESGAGKTENTKKVIQYLAAIATDATPAGSHSRAGSTTAVVPTQGLPRSSSFRNPSAGVTTTTTAKSKLGLLERQILQANPILEAFGNAQTQRNNNSSRFGKFVRITFAGDGSIAGANIDWYLLEKSRVVARAENERSFHAFYQLLEGGGALKDALLLEGGAEDYEFLNKSRRLIDGVDDREEWRLLQTALDVVGFSQAEQFDLFRILAAILHIGNIAIVSDRSGETARIAEPAQAEKACHLLGVSTADFGRAVLSPRVLAGREWVTQARTAQQARDELGALCKTLYEKTFGALVERINRALDRPAPKSTFIGVLDIAGFEIFTENGFEQLCINYTNERLQQYFNHHMFVLEQEEYAREGIEWSFVNFGLDLQPTIDLIEESGARPGILSCLDEECIMPKATDATFTAKLHALWTNSDHPGASKYVPARFAQGFVVQHYAGRVEYRTDGWLAKNKDPLNDNLTRILSVSSERFVAQLFAEGDGAKRVGGVVVKKGAFRTVTQRHKEQLASLMAQLGATQPHFVRCIVPNTLRRPGRVDVPLVLDQLRCNGVLEGIRIARLGYPNRLPFVEFRSRYEVLVPGVLPPGYMDGRKAAARMLAALELDQAHFRIGTTKVFFKAGVLAELEERRDGLLYDIFGRLQAVARKWVARRQMKKILGRAVAARRIQENARLYGALKEWPWWQLYTKVRPLLAATRNDEELRRKSVELELAKERAERDAKERLALETLKMELEADKRRVEEALDAERLRSVDREALLERSTRRQAELEEDVLALQADLDTVDGQLERVQAQLADTTERYKALKAELAVATEVIERLEAEAQEWAARDEERVKADERVVALEADVSALSGELEELKQALAEREEDKARLKERMDATVAELEAKLAAEVTTRDLGRSKVDAAEKEARQAKEELAELTRTATDYAAMIQRKEADSARLAAEVASMRRERDAALKQVSELQSTGETLSVELAAQKDDRERVAAARAKLQAELDELRAAMDAKTSEDTKRSEVERSREIELADLRAQAARMGEELAESRKAAGEAQTTLRTVQRERDELQQGRDLLTRKAEDVEKKAKDAEAQVANAEKARRAAESELQALRMRQVDLDSQLTEAVKAKEASERQLAAAHTKHQDFEDALLQVEREKASWVRQMDSTRKELEDERAKRTQLEKSATQNSSELAKLKDRQVKLERELKKAQDDLHHREWDLQNLRSKQDKTIVEHVHVLEEAKRLTDQQLLDTQAELRAVQSQLRSLQQVKTRLLTDSEDSAREAEKERSLNRAKDKQIRAAEERANQLRAEIDKERKIRESVEGQTRRMEAEAKNVAAQMNDLKQQLTAAIRAKEAYESELASIAGDGDHQNAMNKMRRQYEQRISQLESMVEDADTARAIAERIKQRVDSQHSEIRKLLLSTSGSSNDAFRTRLLRELELAEQQMNAELATRGSARKPKDEIRTFANLAPSKRSSIDANGNFRIRKDSLPDPPRPPPSEKNERQVSQLRQQVQVLELQMLASERVRQHLEASLKDLSSELENSDGSAQSIHSYRAKLARENARLAELLEEEAQARRTAEAAQMDGVKAMWSKFQTTMTQERESYAKLEESRKALMAQQRTTQTELEDQRRQVQELLQSRKQLQAQLSEMTDRLEVEMMAKNDEANARRKLQAQLQELEVATGASSTVNSELQEAAEIWKRKAESYLSKIEAAEIAKAKADRAEAQVRRSLEDAERTIADLANERKAGEARIANLEQHVRDLETKLEEDSREFSDMELFRQRLAEEMEDERHQYQKEMAERDFSLDQTRKKYQAELAQLSEELQFQRDAMSRLRDEMRKLKSEHDELQLRYDDEVYSGSSWKKEKERLESKVGDLTAAYEASNAANAEQQTQIVSLLSQVRELRAHLDEADAERAALSQARRALEARLHDIAQEHLDTSKMSSDRVLQALNLEKQDLRSALQAEADKVALANERVKKAEAFASEYQIELSKIRSENAELDRQNANLEKHVKELNVRIVDLETRAFAASPRPLPASRRLESRIEELQSKLSQESRDKTDTIRAHRTAERDTKFQIVEAERQRVRLEEKLQEAEVQVNEMRQAMDSLQTSESNLQLAKRRAEREANDYKQRALNLERELERLRSRLERPSSVMMGSPASSPRK